MAPASKSTIDKTAGIKLATLARFIGLISAVAGTSYGTNYLSQSQQEAVEQKHESRISVLEIREEAVLKDIVPRSEHEAHWASERQQMDSMQADIREIRRLVERNSGDGGRDGGRK